MITPLNVKTPENTSEQETAPIIYPVGSYWRCEYNEVVQVIDHIEGNPLVQSQEDNNIFTPLVLKPL